MFFLNLQDSKKIASLPDTEDGCCWKDDPDEAACLKIQMLKIKFLINPPALPSQKRELYEPIKKLEVFWANSVAPLL